MHRSHIAPLFALLLSAACSVHDRTGAAEPGAGGGPAGAGGPGSSGGPEGAGRVPGDASGDGGTPPGVDVAPGGGNIQGTVKDASGKPVIGAEIRIVDATSAAGHFASTDAQGTFTLAGVSVPYDLDIAGSVDYLGLTARSLAIVTPVTNASPWPPVTNVALDPGSIRVKLPDCGSSFCTLRYGIDVAGGASVTVYSPSTAPTSLTIPPMTWGGPNPSPCTLWILVQNYATGAAYWYAAVTGHLNADVGPSRGGLTLSSGDPVTPKSLKTTAVTANIDRTALAATDRVALTGSFVAKSESSPIVFSELADVSATTPIPVPSIAGASLLIRAAISSPLSARASETTYHGPIDASAASLVMMAPPQLTAPVTGTAIDASTTFTWAAPAGDVLYRLDFGPSVLAAKRTVYTTTSAVSLARLLVLSDEPLYGSITVSLDAWSPATSGIDGFVSSGGDLTSFPSHGTSAPLNVTRDPPDAGVGEH